MCRVVKKEDRTAGDILLLFIGWAALVPVVLTTYNTHIAIPIAFTAFMAILTVVVILVIRKKK